MVNKEAFFSNYFIDIINKSEFVKKLKNSYGYECFCKGWERKYISSLVNVLYEIGKFALLDYYNEIKEDEGLGYKEFCACLDKQGYKEKIDEKYPVLKDLLNKKMEYEFSGLFIVLENISKHYYEVLDYFNIEKEVKIVEIDTSMGDCHKDKVVAKILLDDGSVFMYKSRETVGEKIVLSLNELLNIDFAIPRTLKMNGFYIQEYVKADLFNNAEEVKAYYWKFGRMAALFTALGTTDLHSENVIATVAGPKYIDLETIISIAPEEYCFKGSALRNTMLFRGSTNKKVYTGMDLSAFSGGNEVEEYVIDEIIQEKNHIFQGKKKIKLQPHNNIPIIKEIGKVNPYEYTKYVLMGFDEEYRKILDNKEKFIHIVEENLNGSIRKVVRNTAFYATFLQSSYLPVYLSSYEKRNSLFDLLSKHSKADSSIIEKEKEELKELLIPLFECNLQNDCKLNKEKALFIKRLNKLDRKFFEQERNVMLLSFELNKVCSFERKEVKSIALGNQSRVEYECNRFLAYAQKGKQLSYVTIDKAIGMNLLEYYNDIFVFGGALITLAFADYFNQSSKYLDIILNTVKEDYRDNESVSGVSGRNSQRGLLFVLYKLYKEETFLSLLLQKENKKKEIRKEKNILCDFSELGSAIIVRIMSRTDKCEEVIDEETKSMIQKYKEEYFEREKRTGLFHGYAGDVVLFSLLAKIEGVKKYEDTLMKLVIKENDNYMDSISNWNDIRTDEIHDMVAISYGAVGILLSRIFLLHKIGDKIDKTLKEMICKDVKRSVSKIISMKRMDYYDDTLINGYSGALLALKVVLMKEVEIFTEKEQEKIISYIDKGRSELEITTWRCQGVDKAYLPNFMNGNMGITFVLLMTDNCYDLM